RALRFSQEWADVASEDAEAKTFWDQFFDIFGVSRKRVASFEKRVKKIDGKDGYIDLLWKGVLLVEHKSRGKDLDRAHAQARDYFHGLSDAELPRYLLVSDFARFRLYDLEGEEAPLEFPLEELYKHVHGFGFIAGYQTRWELLIVHAGANTPSTAQSGGLLPAPGPLSGSLPDRRRGHRAAIGFDPLSPGSGSPASVLETCRRDLPRAVGEPDSPAGPVVATRRGAAS